MREMQKEENLQNFLVKTVNQILMLLVYFWTYYFLSKTSIELQYC